MTVGELLEQLKDQPKDRLVMSASDAEGNDLHKVAEVAEAIWSESYGGTCHPDDFPNLWVDLPEDAIKVVIIWPV